MFDHPEWLARAEEAFDFVLAQMGAPDGRVQHAWRLGRVTAAGLLDDQAAMARAALALFEATGDAARLAQAERIVRATEEKFADGHGGFYTTADDATDVPLARPRTAADNATPAGAGIIAEVFARLFHLTGDAAWRAASRGNVARLHRRRAHLRHARRAVRRRSAGRSGHGGDRRRPGRSARASN